MKESAFKRADVHKAEFMQQCQAMKLQKVGSLCEKLGQPASSSKLLQNFVALALHLRGYRNSTKGLRQKVCKTLNTKLLIVKP
jgi:hypothetical protein